MKANENTYNEMQHMDNYVSKWMKMIDISFMLKY